MNTQRSGGMTAIGILNIIFGSLAVLGSALMILGGGVLAVGASALEAEIGPEAAGMAGGGIFILVMGLLAMTIYSGLIIAGIGVLKLRPWGRTLSIACGAVMVLINGGTILTGGFGLTALVGCSYGGLLIGLFMTTKWKAAFTSSEATAQQDSAENERLRMAA